MPKLRHVLIILFYSVIALVVIGHSPTTLFDNFIGSDTSDTYEMARNIWWFKFAIQNGEPIFYQTWLGYPDGINGIVLLSLPLQYFPMWFFAFFMPLQVAYNLTIIIWMALNGWAMYFLVTYLLNDDDASVLPAILAGMTYMIFPLFQGHLAEGHGGLMVAWSPPLYLWALFQYTRTKTHVWRWLLACIVFFYLSTTGHILQSIYVLIPITGTFLLGKLWQRDWQAVKRILGMGILASGVVLVVLSPAILEATSETSYTATGGYSRYSADLLALVSPSFLHPLLGDLLAYPRRVLGTNLGEGMAYIGVSAGILVLIALITQKDSRWWLLLGFVAWLFALGPILKIFDQPVMLGNQTIPLPFAILQELPGFSLARTPARFNFTLAIAVAVLVGYGSAWLSHHLSGYWRYVVIVLFALAIGWEYQSFESQPLRTAEIPDDVLALSEDESIRAVFNIPYQHALAAKDASFLQTGHQQPLLAGQITRTTPVNPAKLAILQATLDPVLLQGAGADIVILHLARAQEIGELEVLENRADQQLGDPIYQDDQIAVYRVPSVTATETLSYEINRSFTDLSGDMTLIGDGLYQWDGQLYVWLQWQFDGNRPDTDVRFVHIVDANGEIILQDDSSLGVITDGELRTETLVFNLSDLPEGTYLVRTGWYDFNTLTNYVTDNGDGAIMIGRIEK